MTTGANESGGNQQHDAEDDLTLDELHNTHDGQDDRKNLQDAGIQWALL